jgi:hypothetical protein
MRTAQQLFDTSVKHLRQQKQKSYVALFSNETGITQYDCRYTSDEGHHCAIGILIPPAEYKKEMEGQLVNDLIAGNLLTTERSAEFYKHKQLLSCLQDIHDRKPISEWEKQWRMLADDLRLKYSNAQF